MFAETFLSKCFDKVNSAAQKRVAVKINISPVVKEKVFNFKSKKLPNNNKMAAINIVLFNFSLRKVNAKIATKMNMVLWINAPEAPEVN